MRNLHVLLLMCCLTTACELDGYGQSGSAITDPVPTPPATSVEPTPFMPATPAITIPVPLYGPVSSPVFPARLLSAGTSTGIYGIPVGSTIVRVSARVRDNVQGTTGPSTVIIALADQADDAVSLVAASSPSNGSGSFQTITLTTSQPMVTLHTFEVGVFFATGVNTSPGTVAAMDVTYMPPN
jgi:hypothetical protein